MICPKCSHERSDKDDPTIPDYECPACGIVYAKFGKTDANAVRQQIKGQPSIDYGVTIKQIIAILSWPLKQVGNAYVKFATDSIGTQKKQLEKKSSPKRIQPSGDDLMRDHMECARYKTNNVLHLLLSIFTIGGWMFVWLIVSASNTLERNKIHKKYNVKQESMVNVFMFVIFITFVALGYSALVFN